MKICFYAFGSLPIHASSLEERPLGGTETALIRVAEVLAGKGHQVIVVTSHQNPQPFNTQGGPIYIPPQLLSKCGEFDAFIAVQFWKPILDQIPAKRFYFWTGDGQEQYSNLGIGDPRVVQRLTKMFVVSSWHKATLCQASRFPEEKCVVVVMVFIPHTFQMKF